MRKRYQEFLRDGKGKNHFRITVPEERRVDFKSLRRVIEDHGNPVKTMKFE